MTRTQALNQKVDQLKEVIKTTNNGYLFAPTPEQVYIALVRPQQFTVIYNPEVETPFPIKIYSL